MIREYSEKLKEGCDNAASRKTNVDFYDINGKWKSTVFSTPPLEGKKSGIMIVFNESTGDLITGDRQRPKAFTKLQEEGYIGSAKYMTKWNNSSNISGPMPAPASSSLVENQNTGFTPINSFKSDVTGITPSNHSSSDS